MDNPYIVTVFDPMITEDEPAPYAPKSRDQVKLALAGNVGIVSITVEMAGGETATVNIADLLALRWDCIGLQLLIQDWCIQQSKAKQI